MQVRVPHGKHWEANAGQWQHRLLELYWFHKHTDIQSNVEMDPVLTAALLTQERVEGLGSEPCPHSW